MFLKVSNTGLMILFQRILVFLLKVSGVRKNILRKPVSYMSFNKWMIDRNTNPNNKLFFIEKGKSITEKPPIIIGHKISNRFKKYYERQSPDVYVALMQNGKVIGRDCNIIITPDNILLSDLSREFGATGGKKTEDYKILTSQIRFPKLNKLKGKVAVISTCGSSNFHHWLFDTFPRIQILKSANLLDEIDYFLLNFNATPFQKECLAKIDFDCSKIINTAKLNDCYFQAETLIVPSLPQRLSNITPWVVEYLRNLFVSGIQKKENKPEKLYVSRRNAPSRKIINHDTFMKMLEKKGFIEFIPEDYSLKEAASFFSQAKQIISVHGSGLSNLPFINNGTTVIDILAPYHQDPYYWMICNQRGSKYIGLFAEGEHPGDDIDLVKFGSDDNLLIDINKLKMALSAKNNI